MANQVRVDDGHALDVVRGLDRSVEGDKYRPGPLSRHSNDVHKSREIVNSRTSLLVCSSFSAWVLRRLDESVEGV